MNLYVKNSLLILMCKYEQNTASQMRQGISTDSAVIYSHTDLFLFHISSQKCNNVLTNLKNGLNEQEVYFFFLNIPILSTPAHSIQVKVHRLFCFFFFFFLYVRLLTFIFNKHLFQKPQNFYEIKHFAAISHH